MIHRLWQSGAPLAKGNESEDIPRLELFLVPGSKPGGLVIICPGGGYRRRVEHEAYPIARWLNEIGVSAAVLYYRVHPYGYPTPLLDGKRAVRYARYYAGEWNVDPGRIAVMGFSAGGHLASTMGTHFDEGDPMSDDPIDRLSSRPDGLILCYPVITFTEPYTHAGSREAQLGSEPEEALIHALSNELQVNANTPPTFLWHTAEDSSVPPENSLLFAGALSHHGVPFELHIFEQGKHGIGLAPELPDTACWKDNCRHWLKRRGF